jgi:chaperonin cofactor prefoldin
MEEFLWGGSMNSRIDRNTDAVSAPRTEDVLSGRRSKPVVEGEMLENLNRVSVTATELDSRTTQIGAGDYINQLGEKLNSTGSNIATLSEQARELGAKICRKAEALAQLEGFIEKLEGRLRILREGKEVLGERIGKLKAELEASQVDGNEALIGELECTVDDLENCMDENETLIRGLECEMSELQSQNAELPDELPEASAQLASLTEQMASLADQVAGLQANVGSLIGGEDGSTAVNAQLENVRASLTEQVASLTDQLRAANANLETAMQSLSAALAKNGENAAQITDLEGELATIEAELAQVKSELAVPKMQLMKYEAIEEMVDGVLSFSDIHLSRIAAKLIIEEAITSRMGEFDYGNGDVFEWGNSIMGNIVEEMQKNDEVIRLSNLLASVGADDYAISQFRNAVRCELARNPNIRINPEIVSAAIAEDLGNALSVYAVWHNDGLNESMLLNEFLCDKIQGDCGTAKRVAAMRAATHMRNCPRIQEITAQIKAEMEGGAPFPDFQTLRNFREAIVSEWEANPALQAKMQKLEETFKIALEGCSPTKSFPRQVELQNLALMNFLCFSIALIFAPLGGDLLPPSETFPLPSEILASLRDALASLRDALASPENGAVSAMLNTVSTSLGTLCKARLAALISIPAPITASTEFNSKALIGELKGVIADSENIITGSGRTITNAGEITGKAKGTAVQLTAEAVRSLKRQQIIKRLLGEFETMLETFGNLVKINQGPTALSERQVTSKNGAVCCILAYLKDQLALPDAIPIPKATAVSKILMIIDVLSGAQKAKSFVTEECPESALAYYDHGTVKNLLLAALKPLGKSVPKELSQIVTTMCHLLDSAVIDETTPDFSPEQVFAGNEAICNFLTEVEKVGVAKAVPLEILSMLVEQNPPIALNYQKIYNLLIDDKGVLCGVKNNPIIQGALALLKANMESKEIFPKPAPKPAPVPPPARGKKGGPRLAAPPPGPMRTSAAAAASPFVPPPPPDPARTSAAATASPPDAQAQIERLEADKRAAHAKTLARGVIRCDNGDVFSLGTGAAHMYHDVANEGVREAIRAYVSDYRGNPPYGQMQLVLEDRTVDISFDGDKKLSQDAKLNIKSIKLAFLPPEEKAYVPGSSERPGMHQRRCFKVSPHFRADLDAMLAMPRGSQVEVSKVNTFMWRLIAECRDSKNAEFLQRIDSRGSHHVIHYKVDGQRQAFGLWLPHGDQRGGRVRLSSGGILSALEIMAEICYVP